MQRPHGLTPCQSMAWAATLWVEADGTRHLEVAPSRMPYTHLSVLTKHTVTVDHRPSGAFSASLAGAQAGRWILRLWVNNHAGKEAPGLVSSPETLCMLLTF